MGSTAKGIVYPNAGDQPRRLAFETLATTADTAIGNEVSASVSLLGLWANFTPTWTASTTNPTLGNGTLTGRYVQIGKTVRFSIAVTFGSTTNIGSGAYTFSLPVAAATVQQFPVGGARLRDNSAPAYNMRTTYLLGSTTVAVASESGLNMGHNNPWTWAVSDLINISGTYEAA